MRYEAESLFLHDKRRRDARCIHKDAITGSVIEGLNIRRPNDFRAVLMPSMWGPETRWLHDRGVPWANMFAIERNWRVWNTLRGRWLRNRGPRTSPRPLWAREAIDHIDFVNAGLVYVDFYSQPDGNHLRALVKLFRLGIVAKGTTLITTFGVNRGDTFSLQLNARLVGVPPGEAYVLGALRAADAPLQVCSMSHHAYVSLGHTAHFITTHTTF